jgi:hypothetical protein
MKKFTIKLMALFISTVATAKASSLRDIHGDFLAYIGSYLTSEDQLVLANVNHQHANAQAINAGGIYAKCVFEEKPVPQIIKNILYRVTDPIYQDLIAQEIARSIEWMIENKGVPLETLPPFLQSYFHQITPKDFRRVLDNFIIRKDISSQALLHMETCGTYWVHSDTRQEYMDGYIINYASLSYISLQNVLQIQQGGLIPIYIRLKKDELRDTDNTDLLTAFFRLNPDKVLIIDVGTSTFLETFHKSVLENVKKLAFIGRNLIYIRDYFLNNFTKLKSLTLPHGLTRVDDYFLNDCHHLTSLTLPHSLTHVGHRFLYRCHCLTSLTLPNSLTHIGNDFLFECVGFKLLILPNNITHIGHNFLSGCHNLTSLTLPDNLRHIGNNFLYYCIGLTSLTVPHGLTHIGNDFLSCCTVLTSLTLPHDLTHIGNNFLLGCHHLTSLTLPLDLTHIGELFLFKCAGLTSLALPHGLTHIRNDFLCECTGLTSLTLPNNLTHIGNNFLSKCVSLTSLTLPNSLTNIGGYFLVGCPALQEIFVTRGSVIEGILRNQYPYLIPFIRYIN